MKNYSISIEEKLYELLLEMREAKMQALLPWFRYKESGEDKPPEMMALLKKELNPNFQKDNCSLLQLAVEIKDHEILMVSKWPESK